MAMREAGAPTFGYLLRKRLRKHWRGVAATGAMVGIVAAFAIAYMQERREAAERKARALHQAKELINTLLANLSLARGQRSEALAAYTRAEARFRGALAGDRELQAPRPSSHAAEMGAARGWLGSALGKAPLLDPAEGCAASEAGTAARNGGFPTTDRALPAQRHTALHTPRRWALRAAGLGRRLGKRRSLIRRSFANFSPKDFPMAVNSAAGLRMDI